MARGNNQKMKIVYLIKIFLEKTDETHGITMAEIISSLKAYGIEAERKSIYNDIDTLMQSGMDIIGEPRNKTFYYRLVNRKFELAELKLLVDSVQSAKFITAKKSDELIKKIESLASSYEASQLQRQVYVAERVKTMNEGVYYNIDAIHTAIGGNSKITFQYFQWDVHKKMVLKKGGALYKVSPWALAWEDENYYLVAFDSEEDIIKHFRVDKMKNIELTNEKREGKSHFKEFDMAVYAKKVFGMFSGEEQNVRFLCENDMAGVMIDRFGKDIMLIPVDEEHFTTNVKVVASKQFFGWVFALGDKVKIIEPESVVKEIKTEAERLLRQYENE